MKLVSRLHCAYYQRQIIPYLDEALPPRSRSALALHLMRCDECRASVRDIQRIQRSIVESVPPLPPVQPDLWTQIQERLSSGDPSHSRPDLRTMKSRGARKRTSDFRDVSTSRHPQEGRGYGRQAAGLALACALLAVGYKAFDHRAIRKEEPGLGDRNVKIAAEMPAGAAGETIPLAHDLPTTQLGKQVNKSARSRPRGMARAALPALLPAEMRPSHAESHSRIVPPAKPAPFGVLEGLVFSDHDSAPPVSYSLTDRTNPDTHPVPFADGEALAGERSSRRLPGAPASIQLEEASVSPEVRQIVSAVVKAGDSTPVFGAPMPVPPRDALSTRPPSTHELRADVDTPALDAPLKEVSGMALGLEQASTPTNGTIGTEQKPAKRVDTDAARQQQEALSITSLQAGVTSNDFGATTLGGGKITPEKVQAAQPPAAAAPTFSAGPATATASSPVQVQFGETESAHAAPTTPRVPRPVRMSGLQDHGASNGPPSTNSKPSESEVEVGAIGGAGSLPFRRQQANATPAEPAGVPTQALLEYVIAFALSGGPSNIPPESAFPQIATPLGSLEYLAVIAEAFTHIPPPTLRASSPATTRLLTLLSEAEAHRKQVSQKEELQTEILILRTRIPRASPSTQVILNRILSRRESELGQMNR